MCVCGQKATSHEKTRRTCSSPQNLLTKQALRAVQVAVPPDKILTF
jgi:hypothetical protein